MTFTLPYQAIAKLPLLLLAYATQLIMQGESLAYVKDQLGHASIKMTVDTYTHWIPSSNRQAANQLPAPQRSGTGKVIKMKSTGA